MSMKTFSSFSPNVNGTWFWSWKFLILGLAPLNCRFLLLFREERRISKGFLRSSGISGRRCGRLNLTILSLLGWSKYWSINTTSGTKPSWGSLFTGRSRGDECCWRTLWFPGLKRNKVCRVCVYNSQPSVTRSLPGALWISDHPDTQLTSSAGAGASCISVWDLGHKYPLQTQPNWWRHILTSGMVSESWDACLKWTF